METDGQFRRHERDSPIFADTKIGTVPFTKYDVRSRMKFKSQRRRKREGAPSISLFPFLAVLICTMGALVPLLFAITRQARLQAAQAAVSKIAERKAEIKTEHETMQWRIEQLRTSRKKTDAQVADARLELGHLEDHSRDLREKFSILEKTVAELDKLDGDDKRQHSEQFEELQKLRAQIDAAKKQVTEAQLEAASRKTSYAIVPYEGPNQTYRRPIYLECRADAVVLQPEGIEFQETDFEGPLGPGNPLAATLRAVREYLLTNHSFDPQRDGEPYPLLLVRPDGIAAYYAARAAMTSWATDFGYELIEADWKLAYQPRDSQLAKVVQDVLVSARARQQRLMAAAPGAYSKKSKTTYRASPGRGGSVRTGGSAYDDEDTEDSGFVSRQPSGRIGRGYGSSGTGAGGESSGAGTGGGDSPGPTEAERVASLYGNTASGAPSQGGVYPAGRSPSGQYLNSQGGTSGNGYGPAGSGGMIGYAGQQAATGDGYGNGSGTYGGGNGVGGNGTIAGRGGQIGGGSSTGGYGPGGYGGGSIGGGGAGEGPELGGNMNASLSGQGTSAGGSPTYGSLRSSAQSGGYAGDNMGNDGTTGVNSGYSGGAGGSGGFGGIAGGRTANSGIANNNSGGNGTANGISSGGAGAGDGGVSGDGNSQTTAGQGSSKKSTASSAAYIPGGTGQGSESKASRGQNVSAEGYIIGQPQTEKNLPDEKTKAAASRAMADQGNGVPVMPLRPGEWRETEKPPVIKPIEEKLDDKKNGKHAKSLASKRGQDWALPDAAHGSVPVTRPIRVECRSDRLIIVPEAGLAGGKTVPLGIRTDTSTEAFISAVWEHMETWGIAGRGMYWRPILNVYVAPDAEQRFADLQMLLEGSGLKVVRK
jgi:hypothetical protein